MTNIKISGFFVFTISILLAFLSSYISEQNRINHNLITIVNEKKAFTQEISKNIFYLYKNKSSSTKQLDNSIKNFTKNMNNREKLFNEIAPDTLKLHSEKIATLWNRFYLSVQKFRDNSRVTTPYSNLLLETTVKDIYNTNLMLIMEFDKLLKTDKTLFNKSLQNYKYLQYSLFFILVLLLIYLFTQIKIIISFIQKFLIISKNIIQNSSIKNIEPIIIKEKAKEISQATNNFNYLIEKIDKSIRHSSDSIEHSVKSLELVEENIEDLLELLYVMQENKSIDKELTKKEDAIIQSLEELTSSTKNLKSLKTNLENLTSSHNLQNS